MGTAIFTTAAVLSAGLMFFAGYLAGHHQGRTERATLAALLQNARREMGRLGNRIGAHRRRARKLREQLKLLTKDATPLTQNATARPNLPH